MAQRISRAKGQIKASNLPFRLPPEPERTDRLQAVLKMLYLIFNEAYVATTAPSLHRAELATEAIRLTRLANRLMPEEDEVAGLLALMLLTDARRPARMSGDGALIPLAKQDRSRWDEDKIREGVALVETVLARPPVGAYQLQAAIAAVHDEARTAEETDWPQIVALYELLGPDGPEPGGAPEPRRRSGDGRGARGRTRAARAARRRPAAGPRAPPACGSRPPARDGGRQGRSRPGVRGSRPPQHQPAGAALSEDACSGSAGVGGPAPCSGDWALCDPGT